jgi:hypothetical protein
MSKELDPQTRKQAEAFLEAGIARLEKGAVQIGRLERGFTYQPGELLEELQQEALDLAGWGFLLWERLETLKIAAALLEGPDVGSDERTVGGAS